MAANEKGKKGIRMGVNEEFRRLIDEKNIEGAGAAVEQQEEVEGDQQTVGGGWHHEGEEEAVAEDQDAPPQVVAARPPRRSEHRGLLRCHSRSAPNFDLPGAGGHSARCPRIAGLVIAFDVCSEGQTSGH